jgi:hypothetical protein
VPDPVWVKSSLASLSGELGPHPRVQPGLLHEEVEVLGQVDRGDDAAVLAEQAADLGEEDHLVGLGGHRQLAHGAVRSQADDLAARRLAEAGEDGQVAGAQAALDGAVVDLHHPAGEAEAIDVDEVGLEDAGGDGAGPGAHLLQGLDEAEVLAEADAAGDLQDARGGDAHAVDALAGHAVLGEGLVDLGAGAVEDDGVEPHVLEEGERGGEPVEVARQDVAAHLDDGELLRVDGGVLLEVLLDLLARAQVAQEADDDVLGGGHDRYLERSRS